MSKDKSDKHVKRRARLRDSNGGVRFAMVSERLAQRLAGEKGDAAGLPVRVDQHGNVRGIIRQSELQGVELKRGLERFRLPVEQLDFDPHIPQSWQEYLDDWRQEVSNWNMENSGAVAAFNSAPATSERVWVPATPAVPAQKGPPKEGKPARVAQPARPGHWTTVTSRGGHLRPVAGSGSSRR